MPSKIQDDGIALPHSLPWSKLFNDLVIFLEHNSNTSTKNSSPFILSPQSAFPCPLLLTRPLYLIFVVVTLNYFVHSSHAVSVFASASFPNSKYAYVPSPLRTNSILTYNKITFLNFFPFSLPPDETHFSFLYFWF